jgi:hypothetical protein
MTTIELGEKAVDFFTPIRQVQVAYQPHEINDVVNSNVKGFIRPCDTTKTLCEFTKGTMVDFINIKNDWCLIEGTANVTLKDNRKNRKKLKSTTIQKKMRAWVKRESLSIFRSKPILKLAFSQ